MAAGGAFVMLRSLLLCALLAVTVITHPAIGFAQDERDEYVQPSPEPPSLLSYGFKGFWLGGELGLAVGFLSTGNSFGDGEWKNLVFGVGLGALTGVVSGVVLAMVDTGTPPPAYGWYVLRDAGYGTLLGGLSGAAVGALFVLDSGEPRDILTGAAVGSLVGAAVGVAFGVIEANAANRRSRPTYVRDERGLRFTVNAIPPLGPGRPLTLAPTLYGRF
jgi:hypothetical protein